MSRRRILFDICLLVAVIVTIFTGIYFFHDRKYNLSAIIIIGLSCGTFYWVYEKKEGSIRRMIVIAVMVALAVAGRFAFAMIPAFKPVSAIVIIAAVYMGTESGFLIGSLTAVISNMFFGQGPWTPFQMLAWGMIGGLAGIPFMQKSLKQKMWMIVYGIFAGFFYSAVMDIWTALSFNGDFSFARYGVKLLSALPFTITYAISNCVFLLLGMGPIGRKLNRINIKHGIF